MCQCLIVNTYMQVWRWQWCFCEVERSCSWREDERNHGRLISSHEEPEPGIYKKHLRAKDMHAAVLGVL